MRRYAWALVQALVAHHADVEGMRVQLPGSPAIRLSIVAGNIRLHRLMDARLRLGATVVDVGANIGYNTIYAARLVGPTGRVVAVEPAEDNLAVLHQNLLANRLGNVAVIPVAAGRAREVRSLFLRGATSGVNSLFPDSCYAAVTGVAQVQVAPLDDLMDGPADLVKIDVEGAELDVLDGMSRLLRTPHIRLIVEWHPVLQEAAGHTPDRLPHTLLQQGFRLQAAWHTHVSRLDPGDIPALAARLRRSRRPVELVADR